MLNMLNLETCKNIIELCVSTQMKLADSLNNENAPEIINKIKKEIESINNIIQSVTSFMMLHNFLN
jgi:hypothetical protein